MKSSKTSLKTFLRMLWLVLILRKSTKGFYDAFHRDYDNLVEGQPESDDAARFIVDYQAESGMTIKSLLECGCGTGAFSERLIHMGAAIHGIDFSAGQLHELSQKSLGLSLTMGDVRSLPYKSKTFDVVASYQLLPHFPNSEASYFSEAYRVLKPGGIFFVDPMRAGQQKSSLASRAITKALVSFSRIDVWSRTPSVEYLAGQLSREGFEVEAITKTYEKEWTFLVAKKKV